VTYDLPDAKANITAKVKLTSVDEPTLKKPEFDSFVKRGKVAEKEAERVLAAELNEARMVGDIPEVFALLQLWYPDRSPVFGALRVGCLATLKTVLENGANPNLELDGFSPVTSCIMSIADPLSIRKIFPQLNADEVVEILRVLLKAGATPASRDLRLASYHGNPAIGKLLLEFDCSMRDEVGDPMPLLSVASWSCPELVFPLMLRGASQTEPGSESGSPPRYINLSVFLEARWKLLRPVFLLYHRVYPIIDGDVLPRITAFLTEPLRLPGQGSQCPTEVKALQSLKSTSSRFDVSNSIPESSFIVSDLFSEAPLHLPPPLVFNICATQ
jgi:hypothetical protein